MKLVSYCYLKSFLINLLPVFAVLFIYLFRSMNCLTGKKKYVFYLRIRKMGLYFMTKHLSFNQTLSQ